MPPAVSTEFGDHPLRPLAPIDNEGFCSRREEHKLKQIATSRSSKPVPEEACSCPVPLDRIPLPVQEVGWG